MDQQQAVKIADRAALISLSAYVFLSILKITISFIAESSALRADGLNNLTDIAATIAVIVGLRISRKPRDLDHPYGHSKAEQIAMLIASFIMATVGIQVIFQGINTFVTGKYEAPLQLAAWTALGAGAFMFAVYAYIIRVAKKVNSPALKAAAKDNLSDALVSVGACIGIAGASIGWAWLDPLAALIVGIIICKTAWDIFSEATHMLTDGFDPDTLEAYKAKILEVEGVNKLTDLRARMYGNDIHLDVTVLVNAELDVLQSHQIADNIERMLNKDRKHPKLHSHIHIEPDTTVSHTVNENSPLIP